MYETRLTLAKHKTSFDSPQKKSFIEKNCSLEGQIVDPADRIAYNCHDLEDGLRAKLLNYDMIMKIELCVQAAARCQADDISDTFIRNTRIAKTIIDMLVGDCIEAARPAITGEHIENLQQVLESIWITMLMMIY